MTADADGKAPSQLLRATELLLPVVRPRRVRPRVVLVAIAVAVLVVFAVSGFAYLEMWREAGHELTRLLPERTALWARGPAPHVGVVRALELPHWADRQDLADRIATKSFLASDPAGDLLGVPFDIARELVLSADGIDLAVIPHGPGEPASILVVADVQDLRTRRRVAARLSPLLEPASRHLGFPIERIRTSPWSAMGHALGATDVAVPHVVTMDTYFALSWGPIDALEDLLEARVEGEAAALRRRFGFRGFQQDLRLLDGGTHFSSL